MGPHNDKLRRKNINCVIFKHFFFDGGIPYKGIEVITSAITSDGNKKCAYKRHAD